MNVGELLKAQYAQSHQILQGVVADVDAALSRESGGGTLGSIGSIYAHVVFAEDSLVSQFSGTPAVYTASGWESKLGVPMPGIQQTPEWAAGVKLEFPAFHDYAKEVFAATESFAAGLTPEALAREVPGFGGRPTTLAAIIGNIGIIHVNGHMGEIAAIKGAKGLKGLPF